MADSETNEVTLPSATPAADKTRVQRWIDTGKNHPLLSVVIFLAVILGGVAGVINSVKTISTMFSATSEVVTVRMSGQASIRLLDALSKRNERVWVWLHRVPSHMAVENYETAMRRELAKQFSNIRFMNQESIESQFAFMKEGFRLAPARDPEEVWVWGTALILVDISSNELHLIQRPDVPPVAISNVFTSKQ